MLTHLIKTQDPLISNKNTRPSHIPQAPTVVDCGQRSPICHLRTPDHEGIMG